MVKTTQKTIYMNDLQLAALLGEDYSPPENTTLNEKFGVLSNTEVPSGSYPTLKYYAIGVGGSSIVEDSTNYVWSEHSAQDAALFEHIPWVMVPTTNDLTSSEKANYRLRVVETFNGISYACYYLKVIPNIDYKNKIYGVKTVAVSDDSTTATLYNYDTNISEILSPTPRSRSISYTSANSSEFLTKIAKLTFTINSTDLTYINDVLSIRGLEGYTITELGVCTGLDTTYNGYTEAIAAQVAIHIGINLELANLIVSESAFTRYIDVGGYEPLLV